MNIISIWQRQSIRPSVFYSVFFYGEWKFINKCHVNCLGVQCLVAYTLHSIAWEVSSFVKHLIRFCFLHCNNYPHSTQSNMKIHNAFCFHKNTFPCSLRIKKLSNIIWPPVALLLSRRCVLLSFVGNLFSHTMDIFPEDPGPSSTVYTQADFSIRNSTTRLFANRIAEEKRKTKKYPWTLFALRIESSYDTWILQ